MIRLESVLLDHSPVKAEKKQAKPVAIVGIP
jgi:hypothetical protein